MSRARAETQGADEAELGHYPWNLPEYNRIARFLTSLDQSKIETTKCEKCSSVQWPPRSICSKCLSLDLSWVEMPRRGRIVGFAKAYVGTLPEEEQPMLVASVHLDGEPSLRLLTRIIGTRYEDLKIGMTVRLAKTGLVNGKPYWAFSPEV